MRGLRLQVRLPQGALPCWLGETLAALDGQRGLTLQLLREGPPRAAESVVTRWARARCPALREWRPDAEARRQLARWEQGGGAAPDVVLWLSAGAAPERSLQAQAPLHWMLQDSNGGSALCLSWPLLESITRGQGIALRCQQRLEQSGRWTSRRTLHVAAHSRYSRGLDGLAPALTRLLSQALADVQLQAHVPAAAGAAAAEARPTSCREVLSHTARGGWNAWIGRQRARWLSESWRVGVMDAPVEALLQPGPLPPVRWLTESSAEGYWADPFGVPGDDQLVACEFMDQRSGRGRIEYLHVTADAAPPTRRRLDLGDGSHVSFPHIVRIDGRCLGVAETMGMRECVLHEVDEAGDWRPLWPLLQGTAVADPALFFWEGRYWLCCTDSDLGEHDNLCLFFADRLEGPWLPHANNPVKVDICGARMAGQVFVHGGELYRPAQNCLQTYGGATVLQRIVHLSPTGFEETPVRHLVPEPGGSCPHGLHTVNGWGRRTLVDGKRFHFDPRLLLRKLSLRRAQARRRRAGHENAAARGGVFVVVPHLRTGGGELSMLQLAQGFAATGLQVTLVVHTLRSQEVDVPSGVNVLSLDREGTLGALWQLVRALRRHRPQWLLSAFPHTNIAAVVAVALARTGTHCVVSEHAPLSLQIEQQGGWRYRVLPALVRWVYPHSAAVVGVSQGVCADLQQLARSTLAPVVIRNPVLPPDFEDELIQEPDHPWLLDPTLQVVLSVCRLAVEKDLPTLLHAFAEVHRTRPNTRLLLAGEGPERDRLQALVAELKLQAVVQLPGRTRQPLRWMHRAAVFVLASRFEGFGNVLVEALACDTPVVATDCPVGPRELLQGGRWGALVPVGDAAAMAEKIACALRCRVLPPGARDAARRYTQAHACAAYLRLFDAVAAGEDVPC